MNRLSATHIAPERAAVVRISPAALLARLAAGVRPNGADDAYAVACAEHQLWSDLCLVAEGSEQPLRLQRCIRVQTQRAAHLALKAALVAATGAVPEYGCAPTRDIEMLMRGEGGGSELWQDILERALTMPMPESYGYDLADVAICFDDARQFARSYPIERPLIVVGVRSGGSYLAPYWAAGLSLQTGVPPCWTTLRPLGGSGQREGYHGSELQRLIRRCQSLATRGEIVIVDDQPDSGRTVDQLANALAPWAFGLWFASVGKVSRLSGAGRRSPPPARQPLKLRPRPLLWQLLLEEDHSRFLETLAETLPSACLSSAAEVVIRCPTLEQRYGRPHAWLPWNHPSLRQGARRLINPKKTPLTVLDRAGQPMLHLRFVGEGLFGLAEFQRVQRLGIRDDEAWFADGYRVATHIPGLRPLREALARASPVEATALLARCAKALCCCAEQPLAVLEGRLPGAIRVGERIGALLGRLRERTGVVLDLPPVLAWLPEFVVPAFGASRQLVLSSLRYAWGHWHWQVMPDGALRRFHLEANWGGPSWPELEVAAFLLEHRLGPASLHGLRGDTALGLQEEVLAASLPVAALLLLEGHCRELSQVSRDGGVLLRDDLSALWQALALYTDFITTNCMGEHT